MKGIIEKIQTREEAEVEGGMVLAVIKHLIRQRKMDEDYYRNLRGTYERIKDKAKQLGENVCNWFSLPSNYDEAVIKLGVIN